MSGQAATRRRPPRKRAPSGPGILSHAARDRGQCFCRAKQNPVATRRGSQLLGSIPWPRWSRNARPVPAARQAPLGVRSVARDPFRRLLQHRRSIYEKAPRRRPAAASIFAREVPRNRHSGTQVAEEPYGCCATHRARVRHKMPVPSRAPRPAWRRPRHKIPYRKTATGRGLRERQSPDNGAAAPCSRPAHRRSS